MQNIRTTLIKAKNEQRKYIIYLYQLNRIIN